MLCYTYDIRKPDMQVKTFNKNQKHGFPMNKNCYNTYKTKFYFKWYLTSIKHFMVSMLHDDLRTYSNALFLKPIKFHC